MKTSESIINIAAALSAAQAEMPAVAFDSKNPFLHNKYASLGAVIDASQPILAKHGLAVIQFPISGDGSFGVTTRIMHSSGEYLEESASLALNDEKGKSAAQVAGSIVTYLRRYSLQSVLRMYGDEDTDGAAAGDSKQVAVSVKVTRESQPERPTAPAKAAPAVADPQEGWKQYFLKEIAKRGWEIYAWQWGINAELIDDTMKLADADKSVFPNTRGTADAAFAQIERTKDAIKDAGGIPQELDEAYTAAHIEEQVVHEIKPAVAEPAWKGMIMPFGAHKNSRLGDLDQKYLYGLCMNYEPKPWKGKVSDKDAALRKALDEAKDYMGFKEHKKKEEAATAPKVSDKPVDEEVPF